MNEYSVSSQNGPLIGKRGVSDDVDSEGYVEKCIELIATKIDQLHLRKVTFFEDIQKM